MISNKPLVSVIMATYNEKPNIIKSSIQSILDQSYSNFELLIFDDSTNVETKSAIDDMSKDSRVCVYRESTRVGFVESLNKGLKKAQGDFIARMDGDDFALRERLEKEVSFLLTHKNIMVVGGQMDIMDEHNNIVSHRNYPERGIKLWLFSCYRNPLAHPTVMMRRKIVDRGYLYNEKLKMSEDLDFWLRLMNDGYKIANLPDTVLRFRVQSDFINKRVNEKQRMYMSKVRKMNFRTKHPVHGVLSVVAGWIFTHISAESIKTIYKKENKNV